MITRFVVADRAGCGETTNTGVMFMKRFGVGQQFEYRNAAHAFTVVRKKNEWVVAFGRTNESYAFPVEEGRSAIESLLQTRTGEPLQFAKETLARGYAGSVATIGCDDLYFSPLRYEEYSDTIRHVPTNYCVLAFSDGRFDKPLFDVDRAAAIYHGSIRKALGRGFDPCFVAKGDGFCKRRLAWLAGIYILENCRDKYAEVAVLGRDMSSFAVLSNLTDGRLNLEARQ